jgi:hypothetical protein
LQKPRLDDGSGRDDSNYVALYQILSSLALNGRSRELFADGYAMTARDECGEVTFKTVIRDSCEGNARILTHGLGGQDYIKLTCQRSRIVVEGFVKIAYAKQQQRVRVAALNLKVLLSEWRGGRHRSKNSRKRSSTEVRAR